MGQEGKGDKTKIFMQGRPPPPPKLPNKSQNHFFYPNPLGFGAFKRKKFLCPIICSFSFSPFPCEVLDHKFSKTKRDERPRSCPQMKGQLRVENLNIPTKGLIQLRKAEGNKNPLEPFHPIPPSG